jgi:two-component system sensor histidine kinase ComP
MKKKVLLALGIAGFLLLQIWFIFVAFKEDYYGVILKKASDSQWEIDYFEDSRFKIQSGLLEGDLLIQVDGKDPNENFSIRKWGYLGTANTLIVLRSGDFININITGKFQNSFDFICLLANIICICIAWLIYIKTPKTKASLFLCLFFLIIGMLFLSSIASSRGDVVSRSILSYLMLLAPIVLLHFVFLFFKEQSQIELPFSIFNRLYWFITLYSSLQFIYFLPIDTYHLVDYDRKWSVLLFLSALLLNFVMFFYIYFRYRKRNRQVNAIVGFILVTFFVFCLPFALFSFLPIIITGKPAINPAYTAFLVILSPVSYVYLLLSKSLFDIQYVLRRIIYTVLVAVLPATMTIILLVLTSKNTLSMTSLVSNFIYILCTLAFFLYLLEHYVTRFEKFILPRKYLLDQSLKSIIRKLSKISSFHELKTMILDEMVNALQVTGAAIVFQYANDREVISSGRIESIDFLHKLAQEPSEDERSIILNINHNEEYHCYLLIGHKTSNHRLNTSEKQWLSLISSYLSVSLENLYLIRKLTLRVENLVSQIPKQEPANDLFWLRKLLFEIQERERERIAMELHDTTLQDILLVRQSLIGLAERFEQQQKQSMNKVITHLELINDGLRQSCLELNPYLLERIGLIKTIQATIDQNIGLHEFETTFVHDGSTYMGRLDIETQKHLYRIVQELLNNTKKHGKAMHVALQLNVTNGQIQLEYQDDGVGMELQTLEEPHPMRMLSSTGLGLQQIKSRVLHLRGRFELESHPGHGFTFRLWIPIQEGENEL